MTTHLVIGVNEEIKGEEAQEKLQEADICYSKVAHC